MYDEKEEGYYCNFIILQQFIYPCQQCQDLILLISLGF